MRAIDYTPIESQAPLRGLYTSLPSTRIPPEFSPNLLNVVARDGIIKRRTGYLQLGGTLDGAVRELLEFGPIGLAEKLVALTNEAQYYYDGTDWIDVSLEQEASEAITGASNGPPIAFTVVTDLQDEINVGDKIHLIGSTDNTNDGEYTVASVTATEVRVNETIPDDTINNGTLYFTRNYPVASATAGAGGTFTLSEATDFTSVFTAGTTFYVRGSTNNDGTYTVASSTGTPTVITVNESVPSAAGSMGDITVRDDLVTTNSNFINYDKVTDVNGRRLIVTNGIDFPLQWTGDVSGFPNPDHFRRWLPAYPGWSAGSTFDTVRVFKEHMFLGAVNAAADEPQVIAWSTAGDFNDFSTGTSGSQILYDLVGGIVALVTLGDRLVIYAPNAIANGVFVGSPLVFAFETVIPTGTRLASPKTIASINVGHVFASEENFYLYDGTRGLRILSGEIRTDYKSTKDQSQLSLAATLNDFAKRTLFFSFPNLSSDTTIYTMEFDIFNLAQRSWGKEEYENQPICFGFYTASSTLTWEDSPDEALLYPNPSPPPDGATPWEEEIGIWGNEGEISNFKRRVFGTEAGDVFLASESIISDNGTIAEGRYDTLDFTIPQVGLSQFARWTELEFEAAGGVVDVYYSTDLGGSFVLSEQVTLNSDFVQHRVPIDTVSRTLRVRFVFSDDFQLRWVRSWFKPTAAR